MLKLKKKVERYFHSYGLFVSRHQFLMLVLTFIISFSCIYNMHNLPLPGNEPLIFYSEGENFTKTVYDGFSPAYVQQFIIKSTVRPWPGDDASIEKAFKRSLSSVFSFVDELAAFKYDGSLVLQDCEHFNAKNYKKQINHIFPSKGCLVLSPALFWEGNRDIFEGDKDVKSTIMLYSKKSLTNQPSIGELVIGLPYKYTGIKKFGSKSGHHVITYAVTMVLKNYNKVILDSFKLHLQKLYGLPVLKNNAERCWKQNDEQICKDVLKVTTNYFIKPQDGFMPFLLLLYAALGTYIWFSVRKIYFLKSKLGMAFAVVTTVILSQIISVGLVMKLGLKPILSSNWLYPWFGFCYCLENILVITKSVVSCSSHTKVEDKIAYGLEKEAYHIFINKVYEAIFLLSGICFTYSPAIQEICMFSAIAIFSEFVLHMVFFIPVLSIDISRRTYISEEHYPSNYFSSSNTLYYNSRRPFEHTRQPFRIEKQIKSVLNLENGGPAYMQYYSKRLKVWFFLADYRFLKKAFLVLIVSCWCFGETTNNFYEPSEMTLHSKVTEHNKFSDITYDIQDQTTSDLLSYKHWPSLFHHCNISLDNKFISILPPFLVPIVNKFVPDVDENKIPEEKSTKFSDSFKHLDLHLHEINEMTNLQYYMTCSIFAIIGPIGFFILMYLYKCICSRNYGYKRKQRKDSNDSPDGISVPLHLSGHKHLVDLINVDATSVASSDLSGEVKIWDIHSGDCTCTLTRQIKKINETKKSVQHNFTFPERSQVWCLNIKQQLVFCGCADGNIEIWDTNTGKLRGVHTSADKSGIIHLKCHSDTQLVCAKLNGSLSNYNVVATDSLTEHTVKREFSSYLDIGDHEYLLLEVKQQIKSAHQQPISSLKVLKSGRVLTGSCDHTLKLFNIVTGRCERTYTAHSGGITSVHELCGEFVSGCDEGVVCLWNIQSELFKLKLTEHRSAISSLASTNLYIVSTSTDECICVWMRSNGNLMRTVPLTQGCSITTALTNNWCVSGGRNSISLWDIRSGRVARSISVVRNTQVACVNQIVCIGNLSVLCVIGRDLYIVRLPSVLE